jgi:hypothetical protein
MYRNVQCTYTYDFSDDMYIQYARDHDVKFCKAMMFSISRQFGKITMPKSEVRRFTYSF